MTLFGDTLYSAEAPFRVSIPSLLRRQKSPAQSACVSRFGFARTDCVLWWAHGAATVPVLNEDGSSCTCESTEKSCSNEKICDLAFPLIF